jgi:hypothetical protein
VAVQIAGSRSRGISFLVMARPVAEQELCLSPRRVGAKIPVIRDLGVVLLPAGSIPWHCALPPFICLRRPCWPARMSACPIRRRERLPRAKSIRPCALAARTRYRNRETSVPGNRSRGRERAPASATAPFWSDTRNRQFRSRRSFQRRCRTSISRSPNCSPGIRATLLHMPRVTSLPLILGGKCARSLPHFCFSSFLLQKIRLICRSWSRLPNLP